MVNKVSKIPGEILLKLKNSRFYGKLLLKEGSNVIKKMKEAAGVALSGAIYVFFFVLFAYMLIMMWPIILGIICLYIAFFIYLKLSQLNFFERIGEFIGNHSKIIKIVGAVCITLFLGKQIFMPATSLRSVSETSYTVYVTNTGHKYHRGGCRYLWNSKNEIDIEKAIKKGYGACSVCKP